MGQKDITVVAVVLLDENKSSEMKIRYRGESHTGMVICVGQRREQSTTKRAEIETTCDYQQFLRIS
jgi:hypothetical protein